MNRFSESVVEQAALAWLESLGYTILSGLEIAPGELQAEREDYRQVVLETRLRQALQRLNPQVPSDAIQEAFRKLTRPEMPSLIANNHIIHKYLVEGVPVEYPRADRSMGGDLVRLLDYDLIENNEFLAVNQFTVVEDHHERRPDVVLFINGLPLAVLELKNAATQGATIWSAFNQLQTYKEQIPSLFAYNEALVISDGIQARIGTLTANKEWFMPWRTIEGEQLADTKLPQLQVVLEGVFDKRRFLDLIRYFIVFEEAPGAAFVKKMAGYHQYHAVNVAVKETLRASVLPSRVADEGGAYFAKAQREAKRGDKCVGVIWHTQGSGKSLTMAFYAGRVVAQPEMENPTEGEDQHPLLSNRRNIVVIADEAHRSQYDFIDGFARHMREALPNASFIGFTGTPIELTDKNTRAVFGDYVSIYDIERAVKDGATVPIYYESRLVKLEIDEAARPTLDELSSSATCGSQVLTRRAFIRCMLTSPCAVTD